MRIEGSVSNRQQKGRREGGEGPKRWKPAISGLTRGIEVVDVFGLIACADFDDGDAILD
jgi:hypothetical protein